MTSNKGTKNESKKGTKKGKGGSVKGGNGAGAGNGVDSDRAESVAAAIAAITTPSGKVKKIVGKRKRATLEKIKAITLPVCSISIIVYVCLYVTWCIGGGNGGREENKDTIKERSTTI